MARIRTIKPEFWGHPIMVRQDDSIKCMAIALLNLSDDEGYFLAEPALVRSFARPIDEESTITRRCLDQLQKVGWIEVREHPSHGPIGLVVNFTEHQSIDRPKTSKLKDYFSTSNRRSIDEASSLEQGTGNREQGIKNPAPSPSDAGRVKPPKPEKQNKPSKTGPTVSQILAEHDPSSYWELSKVFPGARSSNHRTAAVYWVAALNDGVKGPALVKAGKAFFEALPPDQISKGAIPQLAKWLEQEGYRSFLPDEQPKTPDTATEEARRARQADAEAFLRAKCLNPSLTYEAWRNSHDAQNPAA